VLRQPKPTEGTLNCQQPSRELQLEHRNGQVLLLLLGFQLLSFAVAVAVWRAAPRDR
jgi:hypothetical protein